MQRNNFKKTFLLFMKVVIIGLIFASCSNSEDLINVVPSKDGMGLVSFSIKEKDYETPENVAGTRSAVQMQTKVQDLGDGWQAEVSLVPDTTHKLEPKVATRAINESRHYTIRAYQGSTLKGEIKGTFNGLNFTPDAGDSGEMKLAQGSYDFICFTDNITANGTTLTVNRTAIPDAFYTVERNVSINQTPKQKVAFTTKHAGAKVNVELFFTNCQFAIAPTGPKITTPWGQLVYKAVPKDPINNFQYAIETIANSLPETMDYDIVTNIYSFPSMGQLQESGGLDVGYVSTLSPGEEQGIDSQDLYNGFWLPTTDCSKLKLTFTSGGLYGKSLAGKSVTVPTHVLVEANKQYTIFIRLFMENMYLYSDGTFGFWDKNHGKTPVAVVYDPFRGKAIALKDAKLSGNTNIQWSTSTTRTTPDPIQNYQQLFTSNFGIASSSDITALQVARDYTPRPSTHNGQVPGLKQFLEVGTGIGKMIDRGKKSSWIIPDYSFLIPEVASTIGFTPSPTSINFPEFDLTRLNAAFTKVGGEPLTGTYWMNTECEDGTEFKQAVIRILGNKFSLDILHKNSNAKIRPVFFIR